MPFGAVEEVRALRFCRFVFLASVYQTFLRGYDMEKSTQLNQIFGSQCKKLRKSVTGAEQAACAGLRCLKT